MMKAAAILMTLVMLAAVAGTAFLYLTSNVTVTGLGAEAIEATAQAPTFERVQAELAANTATGILFRSAAPGTAEDYQLITYTVRLQNNTFMTADMVEVRITPQAGDILQLGSERPNALPRQSSGETSVTLLTERNSHSVRELTITYYIWGIPFTTKTVCGK